MQPKPEQTVSMLKGLFEYTKGGDGIIMNVKADMPEEITHAQRERVYLEGERAFEQGIWRANNPYASTSPTLEQVWQNGWDHGRRKKKRQNTVV
jgi:hypothetical protein